jgi:hypothetical protein
MREEDVSRESEITPAFIDKRSTRVAYVSHQGLHQRLAPLFFEKP